MRPHYPEYGPGVSDVVHKTMGIRVNIARQPVQITMRDYRTANNPELVFAQPGDGQISLDTTALVEPVGVDNPSRFNIYIGAANTL